MRIFYLLVFLISLAAPRLNAAGISVDSGLTPPLDRWIVRSQVRLTGREPITAGAAEMDATVVPLVVAYGLRSGVTVMLRQAVMSREMGAMSETGLGDTFLMAKFKALRINTRSYVFGIAPTLGLELPTGETGLSSDTWDLRPGLFFTFRHGLWDEDLVLAYTWNGMAGESAGGVDPGDELAINFAIARQFGLNNDFSITLAPLLELSYLDVSHAELGGNPVGDTGESVIYLSPGVKLTINSLVLEALWQNPSWQHQNGSLAERRSTVLVGARVMF
ncbi:MAG: transporter [Candidatus Glassbacteria bacterium]|nr:transporter [Candidatus Glassbacteria bacterium]